MTTTDRNEREQLSPEEAAYEIPGIWTDEWFTEDDRVRLPEIARHIPTKVNSILDAGCGNGLFLHHLRENMPQIQRLCGAERSSSALQHVRTEKHQASIDAMPFEDRSFDLVSCQEVLEHLPQATFEGALSELSRIAERYILATVPFDQDLTVGMVVCPECRCRFNADYHVRSFDEHAMKTLFDRHDLRCKEIFYVLPRQSLHQPIAKLVDLGRNAAKQWVRGLNAIYPGFAVCPACGYRDTEKSLQNSGGSSKKPTLMGRAVKLLSRKQTHRWIGALYERA